MRRIALVALLALGSCTFAVKHPAVTTGLVAGSLSLGMCELNSGDQAACFGISGGVGVGLATIAAIAIWLGSEPEAEPPQAGAPRPVVDWSKIPDTTPVPAAPPPPAPEPPPAAPPAPAPTP